jgi:hypothetical protein
MYSDALWVPEVFKRKNAKACMLVFVTSATATEEIRKLCSELDIASTAAKKKLNIVYPVYPSPDEPVVADLWHRLNPAASVPTFVFTTPTGDATKERFTGVPSLDQLMAGLGRLVP